MMISLMSLSVSFLLTCLLGTAVDAFQTTNHVSAQKRSQYHVNNYDCPFLQVPPQQGKKRHVVGVGTSLRMKQEGSSSSGFDLDAMLNRVKEKMPNMDSISSNKELDILSTKMKDIDATKIVKAARDNAFSGVFGDRGEGYFVAQAVLMVLVVVGSLPVLGDILTIVLGPLLTVTGLGVLTLSVANLGSALSPWPAPADTSDATLVKDGLYSYIRHPMYAGVLAFSFGLGITTGSILRLILAAALLYVFEIKTEYEEEKLIDKYGYEYANYQKEVTGKFFPNQVLDILPWSRKDFE